MEGMMNAIGPAIGSFLKKVVDAVMGLFQDLFKGMQGQDAKEFAKEKGQDAQAPLDVSRAARGISQHM